MEPRCASRSERTALIELPLATMASYEHIYALVYAHGETEWTAHLIPRMPQSACATVDSFSARG